MVSQLSVDAEKTGDHDHRDGLHNQGKHEWLATVESIEEEDRVGWAEEEDRNVKTRDPEGRCDSETH